MSLKMILKPLFCNRLLKCCNARTFRIIRTYTNEANSSDAAADFVEEKCKQIGLTKDEQRKLLHKRPEPREDMMTLKVALIGAPNAGKSTTANRILGWKFAPVSQKVHTTRCKTLGVLTEDNRQLVFLDTPGVIVPSKMKKHNLEPSLLVDPHLALNEADMIMVVVDVSNIWGRFHLEPEVLKMLTYHRDKDSILVLNKVDCIKNKQELLNVSRVLSCGHLDGKLYHSTQKLVKKRGPDLKELFENCKDMKKNHQLVNEENPLAPNSNEEDLPQSNPSKGNEMTIDSLPKFNLPEKLDLRKPAHWQIYYRTLDEIGRRIHDQKGWPFFKEIFMTSAIDGDGVFDLKNYLLNSAKPAPWRYEEDVVTDQDPKDLAEQIVWEKLLENLPKEIPYQIKIKRVLWVVGDDDFLRAQFELHCTKRRHVETLLGRNGETIQKISSEVKQELMNAFRREMSLQLVVRGNEATTPRKKPVAPKKKIPEDSD